MRKIILLAALFSLTGCYGVQGWNPAPTPGGYGVWTHDPAVNNGCNEYDSEPVAEVDNQGNLCQYPVP